MRALTQKNSIKNKHKSSHAALQQHTTGDAGFNIQPVCMLLLFFSLCLQKRHTWFLPPLLFFVVSLSVCRCCFGGSFVLR
jgi:hypothetical protein